MVVKTITITEEAYDSLKQLKKKNKSFSEVIIEVTGERKGDASSVLGLLKDKDVEKIKSEISKRRKEVSGDFLVREKKFRRALNDTS